MKPTLHLAALSLWVGTSQLSAATLYVSPTNPNPAPPYSTWATAATNIQDAVDAATNGDEILVTNGVYSAGGRTVGSGVLTNRVVVDKAITLQSVNGPEVTWIVGYQVPGSSGGDSAIRCAYLASGAVLSGFTLTNGATLATGDFNDQSGAGAWCESASAVITNCILTGNVTLGSGGGVSGGTLNHCVLRGNSAINGGGAYLSALNNCVIATNSATYAGGGASSCSLDNCTVVLNSANAGQGGGIFLTGATNCIIYYNTASDGANYYDGCIGCIPPSFCCTIPLPASGIPAPGAGTGNITNEPLFVSLDGGDFHLQAGSLCIDSGSTVAPLAPTDLDGNPRVSGVAVDLGAYEFQFSGPPVIGEPPLSQTTIPGTNVTFTVLARGALPLSYQWRFNGNDLAGATDSTLSLPHVTTDQAGTYTVVVTNQLGRATSAPADLVLWPGGTAYVWQDSPNPTPPYVTWATAAHEIREAVDIGVPGLVVLVTNGTYETGGRVAGGALTNRVVVDKPLALRSVNGPEFTTIRGFQVPETGNGTSAVRCLYLADGASISGFTLTNGATSQTGTIDDQIGGAIWCQSTNAAVTNCVVAGNSASAQGGGTYRGTFTDCILVGNRARADNGSGGSYAGGALMATLIRCTLAGNSAEGQFGWGGGASGSTLFECLVTNNYASYSGGGAYSCQLYDCAASGNWAAYGGGATSSQLQSCTVTGNTAGNGAGGVNDCSLINSIVYYNHSLDPNTNYESRSTFRNCCTTPLPAGSGNIAFDPQLSSISHLSAGSPCRGAGVSGGATRTDIDGEPWANPPSIGCDEYHPGAVTGPLAITIVADNTNVAAGAPVSFTAVINGRASASAWDFGDGVVVSNRPYASHAWTSPGDYLTVLRAYNDSETAGVSATVAIHVPAQVLHFVAAASTNPVPPFTSWTTAARSIQDAVDVSIPGDEVLVADGVYSSGARTIGTSLLPNRIAVTNRVAVRSANGPASTFIEGTQAPAGGNGDGAVRCAYLDNGASLSGFTLTNGATRTAGDLLGDQAGGGIWSGPGGAAISNCVLVGNSAVNGGGSFSGTLYNSLLINNSTPPDGRGGGGALQSALYNCTVAGNTASFAGGVLNGALFNCIVYGNTGSDESNYWACTLNYCCTMPMPTNGVGNITNPPLFVGAAGGDFHLQARSPCINAGNNAFAGGTDLDGSPRVAGETVDLGAYEFQTVTTFISYAWLQQNGLPLDGSMDYADPDGDGMSNWQEWACGTDPQNAQSVLRLLSVAPADRGLTVTWQSVAGISYFLQRGANLNPVLKPGQASFVLVATNIIGQAGTTAYTDTNAPVAVPLFYRVGVRVP